MLRFGYDDSVMRHLARLFIHLIVTIARLDDYRWKKHCRGLYQLPIAA